MTVSEQALLRDRRRVILMRHGEASYFHADGTPRDPRAVPLTERGRAQAAAAREALGGMRLDRVVCSGMPRARETAAIAAGREDAVEDLPALREIRAGRFRDLPDDALRAAIADAYDQAGRPEGRFIGGEPFAEARARVLEAWAGLLADAGWRTLLVVAHDAVNRILLAEACGAGLAGLAALEQDLACLNLIDVDGAGPTARCRLRAVNITPYDPLKTACHLTSMERVYLGYAPSRRSADE